MTKISFIIFFSIFLVKCVADTFDGHELTLSFFDEIVPAPNQDLNASLPLNYFTHLKVENRKALCIAAKNMNFTLLRLLDGLGSESETSDQENLSYFTKKYDLRITISSADTVTKSELMTSCPTIPPIYLSKMDSNKMNKIVVWLPIGGALSFLQQRPKIRFTLQYLVSDLKECLPPKNDSRNAKYDVKEKEFEELFESKCNTSHHQLEEERLSNLSVDQRLFICFMVKKHLEESSVMMEWENYYPKVEEPRVFLFNRYGTEEPTFAFRCPTSSKMYLYLKDSQPGDEDNSFRVGGFLVRNQMKHNGQSNNIV